MALFLENFEQTEEGKKLNDTIPKDVLDNCRMVYKLDEETNRYVFKAFWDLDGTYDDEDVVLPIQSTFDKMWELNQSGTAFVNVIGSSRDPKPSGDSWIELMRKKYKKYNDDKGTSYVCKTCCTDRHFYDLTGNVIWENGQVKTCSCNISVGGHVIIGEMKPREITPGGPVDLLPICSTHNVFKYQSSDTGANYYMVTDGAYLVMRMKGYLQRDGIQSYIDKCGIENIKRI